MLIAYIGTKPHMSVQKLGLFARNVPREVEDAAALELLTQNCREMARVLPCAVCAARSLETAEPRAKKAK